MRHAMGLLTAVFVVWCAAARADDQPALSAQITRKGMRDVNLYFDKATGLPARADMTARDVFMDGEVAHEFLFSEYKEFDGVKTYTKLVWNKDGKKYLERELGEI